MGRLDRAVQELPAQEDVGSGCGLSAVRRRRVPANVPVKKKRGGRVVSETRETPIFPFLAGIEGARACKHPKGLLKEWLMHWVVLSSVWETGSRRHWEWMFCIGTGRPRGVRLQNREAVLGQLEAASSCGTGRRFKFEIEVLTTERVSGSMLWNAMNELEWQQQVVLQRMLVQVPRVPVAPGRAGACPWHLGQARQRWSGLSGCLGSEPQLWAVV